MTNQHPRPGRLAARTAIVTGASGGIGIQIVNSFVREGATVVALDLAPADSLTAQALRDIDPRVSYQQIDISSELQVGAFFNELTDQSVAVDILINNAGMMLGKSMLDTSVEDWDRLMAVNGRGTFLMTRGCVPLMREASGSIVNISSGAAVKPLKNLAAYGASKAAINAFTKAVAQEIAPIRCNVVCPGPIDTPMPHKFVERLDSVAKTRVFDELAAGRALKRLGRPEEIAAVVLFLASDESSYVTGMEFNVDGGKP